MARRPKKKTQQSKKKTQQSKKMPRQLTEPEKARREFEACLRSGWERNYREAIIAAFHGDASRLVDLLRAHRQPTDDDHERLVTFFISRKRQLDVRLRKALVSQPLDDDTLDRLADFAVEMARGPGGERDEAVHEAARLADAMMDAWRESYWLAKGESPWLVEPQPGDGITRRQCKVPGHVRDEAIKLACKKIAIESGEPVNESGELVNEERDLKFREQVTYLHGKRHRRL